MHTIASSQDTEITLGVGKLLGLFFLLAAICGVFFSIGYSLGRSSGREQAANDQVQVSSDSASSTSTTSQGKPSAEIAKPQEQAPASTAAVPAGQDTKLTFYKAVQQDSTGETPAEMPRTAEPEPKAAAVSAPAKAPERTTSQPNAEVVSHSSPVTGPGTIVVQIAALSREDDAVALAGALRRKNYNVFVVNNPVTHDKFYHVQVGPFATMAEAEAMKIKLVGEGYNPIIKK